jgi:hypothetical protein
MPNRGNRWEPIRVNFAIGDRQNRLAARLTHALHRHRQKKSAQSTLQGVRKRSLMGSARRGFFRSEWRDPLSLQHR